MSLLGNLNDLYLFNDYYPTASANLHIISLQVYDMNTPVNPTLYWKKVRFTEVNDFLISALYFGYLLEQPSSFFFLVKIAILTASKIALPLTGVLL